MNRHTFYSPLPLWERVRVRGERLYLHTPNLLLPSRHTLALSPISCGYPTTYPRNPADFMRDHPGTTPAQSFALSSHLSFLPGISPLSPRIFSPFPPIFSLFPLRKITKKPGSRITDPRAYSHPCLSFSLTTGNWLLTTASWPLPTSSLRPASPWSWCRTWGRGCRSLFRPR